MFVDQPTAEHIACKSQRACIFQHTASWYGNKALHRDDRPSGSRVRSMYIHTIPRQSASHLSHPTCVFQGCPVFGRLSASCVNHEWSGFATQHLTCEGGRLTGSLREPLLAFLCPVWPLCRRRISFPAHLSPTDRSLKFIDWSRALLGPGKGGNRGSSTASTPSVDLSQT